MVFEIFRAALNVSSGLLSLQTVVKTPRGGGGGGPVRVCDEYIRVVSRLAARFAAIAPSGSPHLSPREHAASPVRVFVVVVVVDTLLY